ncbi:MAG: AraC family transcriptional regulator [Bacteroidales bacterium]|nr:AraC family transcriptional regulator [Candidatus Equimonas enterica]
MDKKAVKKVQINDMAAFACPTRLPESNDILFVENFHDIDFQNEGLQLGGFLTFCLCKKGSATFRLGKRRHNFQSHDLFVVIGELIFDEVEPSEDFEAIMMIVSRQFAMDCFAGLIHLWPYLLRLIEAPVIHLTPMEEKRLLHYYKVLTHRMQETEHPFLSEIIKMLIRIYYLDLSQMLSIRHTDLNTSLNKGYAVFDRFMMLVSTNFTRERNVTWYSDQLGITAKYLSEVTKGVSGRTAGQWIQYFVTVESKQLLRDPSLSIKDITARLHFCTQSHFGKYFHNATGIAPSDYRKRVIL